MAVITSAGSGGWSSPSTWSGAVVPDPISDSVVIRAGDTVTITDNRTLPPTTVGDTSSSTGGGLTIAQNVSVTLGGNLVVRSEAGHSAIFVQEQGSTLDLSVYTVQMGYFSAWNTSSQTVWQINGTSGNRATITGSTGSLIDFYYSSASIKSAVNWSYVTISGVDSGPATNKANRIQGQGGGMLFSNCLFKNCGSWIFGWNSALTRSTQNSWLHCDFRSMTVRTGNNPMPANHVVFNMGSGSPSYRPQMRVCTFSNNLVNRMLIYNYGENWDSYDNVFDNCIYTGTSTAGSDYQRVFIGSFLDTAENFTTSTKNTIYRYNGFVGTAANTHGTSHGTTNEAPGAKSVVSHSFWHTENYSDNGMQYGGSSDLDIHNNLFTGAGSGLNLLRGNVNYSPYIDVNQNTFAMACNTNNFGVAYLAEQTDMPDTAYTVFRNNLNICTAPGAAPVYYSVSTIANQINEIKYNAYYDPNSRFVKFVNISISLWVNETESVLSTPVSTSQFSVTSGGDLSGRYTPATWLRITIGGKYKQCKVVSSVYSGGSTTVTVTPSVLSGSITSVDYGNGYQSEGTGDYASTDITGSVDPQFVDPNYNVTAFATDQGATGTNAQKLQWLCAELCKVNGTAVDGSAANAASYTIGDIYNALIYNLRPRNSTLQTSGEGGTFIGAVDASPDTTAPTVSFTCQTSPPPGDYVIEYELSAVDAGVGIDPYGYAVAGSSTSMIDDPLYPESWGLNPGVSSWTFDTTDLANGSYARYLCAWVKDRAGNIASDEKTVTLTVPVDTTKPTVDTLTIPATATSLAVSGIVMTASDNRRVTGYLLTETATVPLESAAGWSGTAPTSYQFSSAGSKTLYAWAKDGAGNISFSRSAAVVITLSDNEPPTITNFSLVEIPAEGVNIVSISLTATDTSAVGVVGYLVLGGDSDQSGINPYEVPAGLWVPSPPTSYTFGTYNPATKYLSAWAKDSAGNISAPSSLTVTLTAPSIEDVEPPVVTQFTIPPTASSKEYVPVTVSATDNIGVTAYILSDTLQSVTVDNQEWVGVTPSTSWAPSGITYSFSSAGTRQLRLWVRDAAGNIAGPVGPLTIVIQEYATPTDITAIYNAIMNTPLPESYAPHAPDGVNPQEPTLIQLLYMVLAVLTEKHIVGNTMAVKRMDGTTAMTFELDSATAPKSIHRVS